MTDPTTPQAPPPTPGPAGPRSPRSSPLNSPLSSPLSDGEWHRMHPLTPLFRGGLVMLVAIGIVFANLRERLFEWVLVPFIPELQGIGEIERQGDPIDFVFANGLILVVLGGALAVLVLIVVIFYISWRFHTFRITGDDVEVRSGVLFRSHRRAPLDRIQTVNFTRPMIARLFGMSRLEVVGAGADSTVKLEYLGTKDAESVRTDILRLASGRQLAARRGSEEEAPRGSLVGRATETVSEGMSGLVWGEYVPDVEPRSVVEIPIGRIIASRLLSFSTLVLLAAIAGIVVAATIGSAFIAFAIIPTMLAVGAFWIRSTARAMRYSIAPTRHGVRVSFGLFTTVTEMVPPGRVFAAQVTQPLFWRPFGWWKISVNRMSGDASSAAGAETAASLLPVGTRDDIERVLAILLPGRIADDAPGIVAVGLGAPGPDDPYATTPRGARVLRPFSWRRNGVLVREDAVLLRRGAIWRSLALFPLARMQSIGVRQGPIYRALGVVGLDAHTIAGTVSGSIGALARDDALAAWREAEAFAIRAAAEDRTHRWGEDETDAPASADASAPPAPALPPVSALPPAPAGPRIELPPPAPAGPRIELPPPGASS